MHCTSGQDGADPDHWPINAPSSPLPATLHTLLTSIIVWYVNTTTFLGSCLSTPYNQTSRSHKLILRSFDLHLLVIILWFGPAAIFALPDTLRLRTSHPPSSKELFALWSFPFTFHWKRRFYSATLICYILKAFGWLPVILSLLAKCLYLTAFVHGKLVECLLL